MKHHLFSLEVCVHDKASADFVRSHLATIRMTLEDREDLHVFRATETMQKDGNDEEDDGAQTATNSAVHMTS